MNSTLRLATTFLLFFALALVVSSCSRSKESPAEIQQEAFKDVRAEILSAIKDPERAQQVVALVQELEKSFLATRKNVQARRTRMRDLNANYDATREDFVALYDEAKQDMIANRATMVSIHRKMVDTMTAEEWQQVQKAESKALKAAVSSYHSY